MGNYFQNYIPSSHEWTVLISILALLIISLSLIITRFQVRAKTRSLRSSNEALKISKEEAQESNRLKTAFLQNMSHEIRTPMNGILGFLNLLEDPELDLKTKHEYIQLVNQSGERLINTVNEIIDISLIESGNAKLHYSEVNLEQLMQYHYNFFTPKAKKLQITLRLLNNLDSKCCLINTDRIKLDKILVNLLNNAFEYTQKGTIEFGNYLEENNIVFYIKDTGQGIPSNQTKTIFEPFVQIDLNTTRRHEGLGLGLSIAKAEVDALQGKIWVNSTEGKGSIFYFSIPYIPQKKELFPEPIPFKNKLKKYFSTYA